MAHLPELELLRDGTVVRVIRVGEAPIHLGRHLDNTVVLLDDDVSGHHAVVSGGPDGVRIADLRSTNGTWVNGERLAGEGTLRTGDEVRLGQSCVLRVRGAPGVRSRLLVLADLTAGTVHPLTEARVHIGSAPGCVAQIPGAPPRAATLTVDPDEVWLDGEEDGRPIELGEIFEVGGHQLRVDPAPPRAVSTLSLDLVPPRNPYVLAAALDGPGGPAASLRDPTTGRTHVVAGETRATLLYVLGRRRVDDLEAGIPDETAGWMDDEDVLVAVWGRASLRQAASTYSVLLHRLRREVDAGGFDASFLEKRRGATRVWLHALELGGSRGV
jgi:hypothetical protein